MQSLGCSRVIVPENIVFVLRAKKRAINRILVYRAKNWAVFF